MAIIAPLNVQKFIDDLQLKEISSSAIISTRGKFDVDGLFSEVIFGLTNSTERRKTYAFINLNTKVLHPFIYEVFKKIEKRIIDLVDGATLYYDEEKKLLSKDPLEGLKEISGFDGAMYAISHGLNYRGDTDIRDKIIDKLEDVIKDGLFSIDKMIVVPPDFRPAILGPDGSLVSMDDVNSTYVRMINLSKKIRMTDNHDNTGVMSDSALIRKEIQNLVNDLYLFGKLKSGKKTGINRSALLGKRVDFSARSIVTGGYDLPIGVAGVPYRILANIAQPFLVHYFTKTLVVDSTDYNVFMSLLEKNSFDKSNNILVVTNFLNDLAQDKLSMTKEEEAFIIATFQDVLKEKYVLIKRDPSLHKGSWQSFRIQVEKGVAIAVNIAQTNLFNMDFDGDCCAVYMPLSLEAQEDASHMLVPAGTMNLTQASVEIKHELVLCSFIITDNTQRKEPDLGVFDISFFKDNVNYGIQPDKHVWQTLTLKLYTGKSIKTTLGRAIFNSVFPKEFLAKYYDGFIDKQVSSKVMNDDIIQNLFAMYENKTVASILDGVLSLLETYTTVYPNSLTLEEFLQADMFDDLKDKYIKTKSMTEKQKIVEEIETRIKNDLGKKMPMINNIVASGSRGKPNQIRQILVTKGILQDAQGNFLSINESYIDGLTPVSAFLGGYGSRKGIMDRSRSTATTGYLFRKMIYALASVIFDPELNDCGTKKTVKCKITKSNAKLLYNRYIMDGKTKVLLTRDKIKEYYDQYVDLRSPIYCKSIQLCKTCYGDLMRQYNSKYVGIIAGQSLGERGTQEIMKTFHTGGSTDVKVPDLLQQATDNNPLIDRQLLAKYFIQENTKLKFNGEYDVEVFLRHEDYFNLGLTEFTLDSEKSGIVTSNFNIENTMIKEAIVLKPFVSVVLIKKDGVTLDTFDFVVDDRVYLPVEFFETDEYRDEQKVKVIHLKANSKDLPFFINIEISSSDMNVVMQTILGIIEKKNIMKHPEIAFNKLTKIYGDQFNVAYHHIEILISQIFRNSQSPELPARVVEPYSAKVYGIKEISHLESFLSGMLFENMSKSLLNGFVNDSTIHNPLEQLLSNDFNF